MKLHEDKFAFLNIINLIHEDSSIRADILEKDYYVTLLLRELAGKQVTLKPKPLRIAQVIQIRLSQARLSSTVRPEREKFMSSKATEAVTMAAIVEMARIWVYTSCMISLALVHTSVAA